MKISKLKNVLLSLIISSTGLLAGDEFKFLPIFSDDEYKFNFEVAAIVGIADYDKNGIDSGAVYGIDVSFDCPVFTLPGDNLLRQQLSINRFDENGLKVTSYEMNPYYFIDLSDDLVFGFGPGIGMINAEQDNGTGDKWLFTYQAGAGIKYYIDKIVIGADIRYQWTKEKDFGSGYEENLDNAKMLVKVGYAF